MDKVRGTGRKERGRERKTAAGASGTQLGDG